MNERYEIIYITEEGRAIKDNKTGKIYYSEFQIIESLQSKIDKANELIEENKDQVDWLHMPAWELEDILKEDK